MEEYTIILGDKQTLFRMGLKRILEERGGLRVVGEADGAAQLLDVLKDCDPHMAIVSDSMIDGDDDLAIQIRMTHPEMKLLMLAMQGDRDAIHRALRCGAHGYFLRENSGEELFSAIEKIRRGETYVSPDFLKTLADLGPRREQGSAKPILTTREKEILQLVVEGESSKEIAKSLFISVHTVERHRANVMAKLRVRKIAELVRYAMVEGLA